MADTYQLAVHAAFDEIEPAFHAALDASLDPRGAASLFDVVADLGLPTGSKVLDVGCGRGRQAAELARRFGFDVLGIDPVARHAEIEAALASTPLTSGSVAFRPGTAEATGVDASSIDLIFCRDSIMFADLDAAAAEFERVLAPGGWGLVYLVLAGPLMSEPDADHFAALMKGPTLRPADIEGAIERGGLAIRRRIDFQGEWAERSQEQEGEPGRRLLFASRLLRRPDRFIEQFGRDSYDIMLGDCLWHVYRMIGKLTGSAWTFTKP